MDDAPKSWLVNPRQPFNSRIWQEIGVQMLGDCLRYGTSKMKARPEGRNIRITPESPALQKVVE